MTGWPEGTPPEVVDAAGVVEWHETQACPECGPAGCPALTDALRVLARRRLELERSAPLRCVPCQLAVTSGASGHAPCRGVELAGGGVCECECRAEVGTRPRRTPPVDPRLV